MKLRNKVVASGIITGLMSIGFVAGTAIAANADTVGGGTWTYGGTAVSVWSHYYHGSRKHTATACNGMGACIRGTASPGITADGTVGKVPFSGGTSAYWNVL